MLEKKIGLAFGGGGARGLAHIGVIKVLLHEGIMPDVIVGTSIGAVAGALLAVSGEPDAVVKRVQDYFACECFKRMEFDLFREDNKHKNDGLFDALSHFIRKKIFFNVSLASQQSYVKLEDYMDNMQYLIDDMNIEDAKIPLGIVCTDIHSGKEVVLTRGPMRLAVAASSSIPGVFPPIDFQGRMLVDGGWVNQLPVGPCRDLGADIVIGVDVAHELEQTFTMDTGLDIIRRANSITRQTLTSLQSRGADIIIAPDVGKISWAGFDCIEGCINLGEIAAKKALRKIKKCIAMQDESLLNRFLSKLK